MSSHFFCPNPRCLNHDPAPEARRWFTPNGSYSTKAFGIVCRYKCKTCGKSFSTQTFRLDYAAKKVVDYTWLLQNTSSGIHDRAIGRLMQLSPQSVSNRIGRLARQFIAFHTETIAELRLREDMVADGFESFCTSQYFPNNINLLVGKDSQFVFCFNYVLLRRKGRMTEEQKARRTEIEKQVDYPRGALKKMFGELLQQVEKLQRASLKESFILHTDEKLEYRKALAENRQLQQLIREDRFRHHTTSSKEARVYRNPLFAVNYMDREIRKDVANHRRETTCFARNVSNMLNRLVVYFHWHNYYKPYRVARPAYKHRQHAEMSGVSRGSYEQRLQPLLEFRRFLSRSKQVTGFWKDLWLSKIVTPLKKKDEYVPCYAIV